MPNLLLVNIHYHQKVIKDHSASTETHTIISHLQMYVYASVGHYPPEKIPLVMLVYVDIIPQRERERERAVKERERERERAVKSKIFIILLKLRVTTNVINLVFSQNDRFQTRSSGRRMC